MGKFRKIIAIPIYLSILASAICAYAQEDIEDLIDIFESNGEIIAVIEGQKTITCNLRPREEVLWSGSDGYLGAFLTNKHFFIISTSSNAWHVLPLRLDESQNAVASLSQYIALLVTKNRAIGFDAATNQFIETQLPIRDELVKAKAQDHVAVVITSGRAFGLAAKSSAFKTISFRIRETINGIKTTSSKATIHTSDRLLIFESTDATWKEHRLN